MQKWFQVFIDEKDSEESIPMRIDPDQIYGFKKFGSNQTLLLTKIGPYVVCEEYEHLSTRLFTFVNMETSENSEETTMTDVSHSVPLIAQRLVERKRYVVKTKRTISCNDVTIDDSFYDDHQPETNN